MFLSKTVKVKVVVMETVIISAFFMVKNKWSSSSWMLVKYPLGESLEDTFLPFTSYNKTGTGITKQIHFFVGCWLLLIEVTVGWSH